MKEVKNGALQRIKDHGITEALEFLLSNLNESHYAYNGAILLKAQNEGLKTKVEEKLLTIEEAQVYTNRLMKKVHSYINELDHPGPLPKVKKKKRKQRDKGLIKYVLLFQVLILIGICYIIFLLMN